jgi:hypothetical protein
MKNDRKTTLIANRKLKNDRSDISTKRCGVECAYELAENVENDDQSRKRGEGGEEFDVADICESGKREILQGEDCCQVSCHRDEGKEKPTRPCREHKTKKPIVPLSP